MKEQKIADAGVEPKAKISDPQPTPLRPQAAWHLRCIRRQQARLGVLWVQSLICAVLFGALLCCRVLWPQTFEALRQPCLQMIEEGDFAPELVRFAFEALQNIPLPVLQAQAAPAPPAGCSEQAYWPPQERLTFPLGTAQWRLSSGYGWRTHPITGLLRFHKGVDLACAEGVPVLAAQRGVVVSSRRSTSYGNCLRVRHPDGSESMYAHMQYIFVRVGETVTAGQLLGTAGQTGEVTGPHLHFEVLYGGTVYDPSAALGLA